MFTEKIGTLTKISTTQVQLSGSSVLKLGGQQRVLTSPTLLTSVSGIGGLDTGSVAAASLYHVYAVYNGTITGLVASLNATSPLGFTRFYKVGLFSTEASTTNIDVVLKPDSELSVLKVQRKVMSSNNTPTQMNFNGLTIGKRYRLDKMSLFTGCAAGADLRAYSTHNGVDITIEDQDNVGGGEIRLFTSAIFTATATTLTFSEGSGGTRTYAAGCYAELSELPETVNTSAWT